MRWPHRLETYSSVTSSCGRSLGARVWSGRGGTTTSTRWSRVVDVSKVRCQGFLDHLAHLDTFDHLDVDEEPFSRLRCRSFWKHTCFHLRVEPPRSRLHGWPGSSIFEPPRVRS